MLTVALAEFYIGTYTSNTSGPNGVAGSQGVYRAALNTETGELLPPSLFAIAENPSYLAFKGNTLYAVSEKANGEVISFDQNGLTTSIQPTYGDYPCHVSLAGNGSMLLVANYNKGVLTRYPVASSGEVGTGTFFTNTGSGPNKQRQTASHAHFFSAAESKNNSWHIACDLGTDELLAFPGKSTSSEKDLTNPVRTKLPPGAGPRHFDWIPTQEFFFINNELNCTVTSMKLDFKTGAFSVNNTLSTLPAGTDLKGVSTAEIRCHPSGKFVYVTNRGHDSIAAYKVLSDGKLELITIAPSIAKTPRGMNIDASGKWMIVAGQSSDDLHSFSIDQTSGSLKPTGFSIKISKPVDILFR
jgi:6-phosphogluconolactonase